MRIVFVSEWLAEPMGYIENLLPRALAQLGHEVHLVAGDINPPFPNYATTYEPFLGPRRTPQGTSEYFGVTLHRLGAVETPVGVYLRGLPTLLRSLAPDVVQALSASSPYTVQCALAARRIHAPLFLADHWSKSVFLPNRKRRVYYGAYKTLVGPFLNKVTTYCFIPSPEIRAITTGAFGIEDHLVLDDPLGVNTDWHHPLADAGEQARRDAIRASWNCTDGEIVCIYTGRAHSDKGPLVLAEAISQARDTDARFRGIFVGPATEAERSQIEAFDGCRVFPPRPAEELGDVYRGADVAAWPKQESTSILDAMACGLPVIVSDQVHATERTPFSELVYKYGDAPDMARILLTLGDAGKRHDLGRRGGESVRANLSWTAVAERRAVWYSVAGNDANG